MAPHNKPGHYDEKGERDSTESLDLALGGLSTACAQNTFIILS